MDEITWKPVVGHEGLYEISNSGIVKRCARRAFGKKEIFVEESIVKPALNHKGYLKVRILDKEGKRTQDFIHRLVAKAFVDNPENKPEVNHKDGIKINNWDWNLEWNTRKENNDHALRTGLINPHKGEKVINSSISDIDAKRIKQMKEFGLSVRTTAWYMETSKFVVKNIRGGHRWKHV